MKIFKQNIYPKYNDFLHRTTGSTQVLIMAFKSYLTDGIVRELSDEDPEGSKAILSTGEKEYNSNARIEFSNGKNFSDDPFFQIDESRMRNKSELLQKRPIEEEVKMRNES